MGKRGKRKGKLIKGTEAETNEDGNEDGNELGQREHE